MWLAALEQDEELEEDSAFALVEKAFHADPAFLPAAVAYTYDIGSRAPAADRSRLVTGGIEDRALASCLDAVTRRVAGKDRDVVARLREVERRYGPSDCTTLVIAEETINASSRDRLPVTLDEWQRASAPLRQCADTWRWFASVAQDRGDTLTASRAIDVGLRYVEDPLGRLRLWFARRDLRQATGDTAGVRTLDAAIAAAVARDGRDGVRYLYIEQLAARAREPAVAESLSLQAIALARRHHAADRFYGPYESLGGSALDRGDLTAATRYLRVAAAIADSLGWRPLRAEAYTRLGRALVKQGRYAGGLRVLRAALAVVDPHDVYARADVYHNLAHAYESEGAIWEAVGAVNRFAELAAPLVEDGISVISLYDAGLIRWKAGLHASSRVAFEHMVRVIDGRRLNQYYAGEYYERIGDFPKARHYYSLVTPNDGEEGARALAGLVRTFEALGLTDSAEAAARRHDAVPQTPEETPLVPEVLAAHGQRAKAVALARSWYATQRARGNIQGGVLAALFVSRLSFETGDFAGALTSAREADSLAALGNVPERRLEAAIFGARASLSLGRTAEAIERLRGVARIARAQPPTAIACDYFIVLGNALAAGGRPDEALVAYSEAAGHVERMTDRFDEDLDRARFHGQRMAPFDGALRLLLRSPSDRIDIGAVLRWSARRKRALDAQQGSPGGQSHRPPVSIAAVRAALGPAGVFVGYTVIDSSIFAVSIDHVNASVTRLPVTAPELAQEQDALRRPMRAYMGRVDLARARFDEALSYRLYRQLIAPIERTFPANARLYISPDGPVHLIPFDALATGSQVPGADGRRAAGLTPLTPLTPMLVDRYEISYVPSAATLVEHFSGAYAESVDGKLLVIGTGVPGEGDEVASVTDAWADPRQTTVRTGGAATKADLAALAPTFDVIHFATHADANMVDPLASHLELAKTAHDDGLLNLPEIERLHLKARLVVLSGCETQAGPLYRGGGPIGLAQAFLWAGADAVVATQWPIGAPAALFMKEFYKGVRADGDVAAALRSARRSLRANPATSSPFLWASFVLVDGAR